jgi:hypothetical protein
MKQQINFRASGLTAQQLSKLIQLTGMNQTEVVSVAIDRMFREETMSSNKSFTIRKIEPVDVWMDGQHIGQANQIITNQTGEYYGENGEYLQDNGEYVPVRGNGVEVK